MSRGRSGSPKPSRGFIIAVAVLVAIIVIVLAVVYVVRPDLYHKYAGIGDHTWTEYTVVKQNSCGENGLKKRECTVCLEVETVIIPATGEHVMGDDNICTICRYDNNSPEGTEVEIAAAELSVHFLEMGVSNAGDCTLIKMGNTEVLIDAGAKVRTAPTKQMLDYVEKYCTDGVLEYVIATHAHEDHIAGLVGQVSGDTRTGFLYKYRIGTLIQFSGHNTTSNVYKNYAARVEELRESGTNVYDAIDCTKKQNGATDVFYLDEAHTVSMNILYQKYYEQKASSENDYSVCMLLKHEIDTGVYNNYIFTGDLEKGGEQSLVDNNELPECILYKGGHHGSKTSSNECLMSVIKPKYIAVCCCAGTDEYTDVNANQFPTQDFVNRVAPYTDFVFCTSMVSDNAAGWEPMNGNIVFYIKGQKLKYWCSNSFKKLKEWEWFKQNRTCPDEWQ